MTKKSIVIVIGYYRKFSKIPINEEALLSSMHNESTSQILGGYHQIWIEEKSLELGSFFD